MSTSATIWASFLFTLLVVLIDTANVLRAKRSVRKKLKSTHTVGNDE